MLIQYYYLTYCPCSYFANCSNNILYKPLFPSQALTPGWARHLVVTSVWSSIIWNSFSDILCHDMDIFEEDRHRVSRGPLDLGLLLTHETIIIILVRHFGQLPQKWCFFLLSVSVVTCCHFVLLLVLWMVAFAVIFNMTVSGIVLYHQGILSSV